MKNDPTALRAKAEAKLKGFADAAKAKQAVVTETGKQAAKAEFASAQVSEAETKKKRLWMVAGAVALVGGGFLLWRKK